MNAYTYCGFDHKWKTSKSSLDDEDLILGVGMDFVLWNGRIYLNPEVSVTSPRFAKSQRMPEETIVQEKNISYVLTSEITF